MSEVGAGRSGRPFRSQAARVATPTEPYLPPSNEVGEVTFMSKMLGTKVLLATDGSEEAELATRAAVELC